MWSEVGEEMENSPFGFCITISASNGSKFAHLCPWAPGWPNLAGKTAVFSVSELPGEARVWFTGGFWDLDVISHALPSLLVLSLVVLRLCHMDGKVVLPLHSLLLPPSQWYSVWLMLQKLDFQCLIFLMIFIQYSFALTLKWNSKLNH